MNNTTDINRLHDVASGRLTGRQCGTTYLACHDICGAIELGETNILAIVKAMRDIGYITFMLEGVMNEHELVFRRLSREKYAVMSHSDESVVIEFISSQSRIHERLAGNRSHIVDFVDY